MRTRGNWPEASKPSGTPVRPTLRSTSAQRPPRSARPCGTRPSSPAAGEPGSCRPRGAGTSTEAAPRPPTSSTSSTSSWPGSAPQYSLTGPTPTNQPPHPATPLNPSGAAACPPPTPGTRTPALPDQADRLAHLDAPEAAKWHGGVLGKAEPHPALGRGCGSGGSQVRLRGRV